MKKILFTAFLMFFSLTAIAAKSPNMVYDEHNDDAEATFVTKDVKILPKTIHQENPTLSYTIDASYPQIVAKPLSPAAKQFNQQVNTLVAQQVQQFINYVKENLPNVQSIPESARHNTLHIDYDVDVIQPNSKKQLISIRLSIEGSQAGRGHPYHAHRVLNFDYNTGKVLSFNDIFKPRTKYLNVFASLSNKKLMQTLKDKWLISQGTAPVEKNYETWNLQSDGILITFNDYQVAPYADGAQEVEIPYSALKNFIASSAPIRG